MPKKPSDTVVEHRISFQDKERDLIQQYIAIDGIKGVAMAIPALVAAAGLGIAGFAVYWASKKLYNWGEDAATEIQEWLQEAGVEGGITETIVGKQTYTNEETGATYNNPFAGVPVLGSLLGTGINLGIATSPFSNGSTDEWGMNQDVWTEQRKKHNMQWLLSKGYVHPETGEYIGPTSGEGSETLQEIYRKSFTGASNMPNRA